MHWTSLSLMSSSFWSRWNLEINEFANTPTPDYCERKETEVNWLFSENLISSIVHSIHFIHKLLSLTTDSLLLPKQCSNRVWTAPGKTYCTDPSCLTSRSLWNCGVSTTSSIHGVSFISPYNPICNWSQRRAGILSRFNIEWLSYAPLFSTWTTHRIIHFHWVVDYLGGFVTITRRITHFHWVVDYLGGFVMVCQLEIKIFCVRKRKRRMFFDIVVE